MIGLFEVKVITAATKSSNLLSGISNAAADVVLAIGSCGFGFDLISRDFLSAVCLSGVIDINTRRPNRGMRCAAQYNKQKFNNSLTMSE
jgi:hypothetical protein